MEGTGFVPYRDAAQADRVSTLGDDEASTRSGGLHIENEQDVGVAARFQDLLQSAPRYWRHVGLTWDLDVGPGEVGLHRTGLTAVLQPYVDEQLVGDRIPTRPEHRGAPVVETLGVANLQLLGRARQSGAQQCHPVKQARGPHATCRHGRPTNIATGDLSDRGNADDQDRDRCQYNQQAADRRDHLGGHDNLSYDIWSHPLSDRRDRSPQPGIDIHAREPIICAQRWEGG